MVYWKIDSASIKFDPGEFSFRKRVSFNAEGRQRFLLLFAFAQSDTNLMVFPPTDSNAMRGRWGLIDFNFSFSKAFLHNLPWFPKRAAKTFTHLQGQTLTIHFSN